MLRREFTQSGHAPSVVPPAPKPPPKPAANKREEAEERRAFAKSEQAANAIPSIPAVGEEKVNSAAQSYAAWAKTVEEGKFDKEKYAKAVAQGRQESEEKKNSGNWLSTIWNASMSAVWSVLSPATNVGGGGLLSVREDDPPNPIKEWWDNLSKSPGEKLLVNAESLGLTYSPEMKTYMIASIEVQRKSIDFGSTDDNAHLGPAQLSRNELDTDYKQGFNADGSECNGADCLGYGLGLPGTNPEDGDTAVLGMDRRIQQVLDKAENLSDKNNIVVTNTDKYIIVAMAQNGGGFDLDDINRVTTPKNGFIKDGKIDL